MNRKLLLAGGGVTLAGAAIVAYLNRAKLAKVGNMVIDETKKLAFQAVISSAARAYANEILSASAAAGVNPFVTVALGEQETLWGTARAYKQDAGDWTARRGSWLTASGVQTMDASQLPAGWSAGGKTGTVAIPDDGLGWGRGLMQIDWGSNQAWLTANDWRDPATNIARGLDILKGKMRYLTSKGVADSDLIPASIAAYNAGEGAVWKAYSSGGLEAVDTVTANGHYSENVMTKIASLTSAFEAQTGEAISGFGWLAAATARRPA